MIKTSQYEHMRMTDQDANFGNVSALRAQLQEKLAIGSNNPGTSPHLRSRSATPSSKTVSPEPASSPPVPNHKPFQLELEQALADSQNHNSHASLPPPPPRHRKLSPGNDSARGGAPNNWRPPIAPKPKGLEDRKRSAPVLSMSTTTSTPSPIAPPPTPKITISNGEFAATSNTNQRDDCHQSASTNTLNGNKEEEPAVTNTTASGVVNEPESAVGASVLARARHFEEAGVLPIIMPSSSSSAVVHTRDISMSNTTINTTRPESTISSLSLNSYEHDMSDSESDEENERPAELLRKNLGVDLLLPGARSIRRPSSSCFNGDITMHDKIMDELKRQGVVRSSSHQHLFKKRIDTHPARGVRRIPSDVTRTSSLAVPSVSSPIEDEDEVDVDPDSVKGDELPDDVGKMREEKKTRVPELVLSTASASSSTSTTAHDTINSTQQGRDRVESMLSVSDRSSVLTSSDAGDGVLDYHTGDPDEDKRLKKLHYAANEFYTVQKKFLNYLIDMGDIYPQYVCEFGKRLGRDLLSPPPGMPSHPVRQLQDLIKQLIPVHRLLLEQFATQNASWNSLNPGMADVILKYSDFLKICKPFLLKKSTFVLELTKLREENKDFDNATVAFEQKIFNLGVGSVAHQLDQVHQNFMRYKILTISYRNYLKEGDTEWKKTCEAISKLEKIAQSVNEAMGLPTNEDLFQLYDRFQCQVDVFYPGRRLIRQGEVMKQARKGPQPRYLVLFSDALWLCRVASGLGSSGLFDMNRSYHTPIESVRVEVKDHEEYEKMLQVMSKALSANLIFSSVNERAHWQADIVAAREEKRRYKRRMSEALDRQRRQSTTPLPLQPTLEESPCVVECSRSGGHEIEEMELGDDCVVSLSRSQSVDSPMQSLPCTPTEEMPGPSIGRPVSKRKILRAEKDKPLWIPDDASSKCLMEGCGSVFSLLNRRHHCRDCGWLICSTCSGRAPLFKFNFKKELVCPECYSKILEKYNNGSLFPQHYLVRTSDDQWRVRIRRGKSKVSTLVEPQSLFCAPTNAGLKRLRIDDRLSQGDGLVFSKVHVKTKKGSEMLRFAQLTDGMILKFYKAPFDDEPCEQHVIYGFDLRERDLSEGGTEFELVHRNQIRTDRKEHVIIFRVAHEKSIKKWSTALHQGLSPTIQASSDSASLNIENDDT